jgi:hypothetical protein
MLRQFSNTDTFPNLQKSTMKFYSNALVGLVFATSSLFGDALHSECAIESTSHSVCAYGDSQKYAVYAQTEVSFAGVISTIDGGDVGGASVTMVNTPAQREGVVTAVSIDFAAHVIAAHTQAMALTASTTTAATEIGGMTYSAGVYKFDSAINIAFGTTVTLDGEGSYVFQAGSTLVTAADTYFILKNGAKAENILWVLGSAATLGARSVVEGSIMAKASITFGAQSELRGCALAQGAVAFTSEGTVNLKTQPSPVCSAQSLSESVCQDFAVHARTAVTFQAGDTVDGGMVGVSPNPITSINGKDVVQFVAGGAISEDSAEFGLSVAFAHSAAIAHQPDSKYMGEAIELGGNKYGPGTYRAGSAMNLKASTFVTLDGENDPNAKFVFQAGTTLVTGANTRVHLIRGAKWENVLWALGSAATLGAGSIVHGSIIAGTSITFGPHSELHGCALALDEVTFPNGASVSLEATVTTEIATATSTSPTEGGGGFGDPHFKTWLGDTYDFHGQCDMILTKSAGFGGGLGLEIQVRTKIIHDWSFIAETVVKIGNDVLEVGSHAAFHMNGVAAEQLTKRADLQELSGFPVKYFKYGSKRHKFEVDLGSKGKIVIKIYNEFLAVGLEDCDLEDFSDSVGLMGSYANGKLVARDGHFITDSKEYGFEWQVRDSDKNLFQEAKGPQYPQQCRMPSATAVKRRRLLESMVSYKEAEHACAGFEEEARESCIFDVLSTGDLKMADAGAM